MIDEEYFSTIVTYNHILPAAADNNTLNLRKLPNFRGGNRTASSFL